MAYEYFKNLFTEGMISISHGNSIWDIITGFFGKKSSTAESKAGDFGKGWGDEHQMEQLHGELTEEELSIWNGFITWNYMGHTGLRAITANSRLKRLRFFITSWDQKAPIGEQRTSLNSATKEAEAKKIEVVKQIFSVKTNHAKDWIKRIVVMIKAEPTKEEGYRKVLTYFDLPQLPRMPAPGEKHFLDTLEEWQEKVLGADPMKGAAEKIQAYAQKIEQKPKGLLYRILSRFSPF